MPKPSSISLTVYSDFRASHSLTGFETPHFHLWKLALEFKAPLPLKTDRLIDLVLLQNQISSITSPLQGCFLNETLTDFSPTSENMAQWVWNEFLKNNPATPLVAVTITLCSLSGEPMGSARIEA